MGQLLKSNMKVLQFHLQGTHICIDLENIDKVLLLTMLEEVPGTPPYFSGLLNYAGTTLPVIDLATLLGIDRTEPYSLDTPILLCSNQSKRAGIIVDKVMGIADMDKQSNHQYPLENNHPNAMFKSSMTIHNELFLLIDMDSVLAIATKTKFDERKPLATIKETFEVSHD